MQQVSTRCKMNEIVNKLLLAGDRFMSEMHLRQPGFTYSASGSFKKNKKIIERFKETGDSRYIYQIKLDKACFQHDLAYGDFKDLTWRTTSDKIMHDKTFNIAKNLNMMDIKGVLLQSLINFLIKKTSGGTGKNKNISNKELAEELTEELHKPIIRKFNNRKVQTSFIDNILGADITDMQLISKI